MPHTDEGTLHAHLDGELTPAEAAELQSHLATCAACRERLDAARVVRDRAHAILRRADPPPVTMPDFGTLQARRTLAPPSAPSRSSRGLALAWAASVAVALGAGWFAQDLLRGGGNQTTAISSREAATVEAASDVAFPDAPQAVMSAPTGAVGAGDGEAARVAAAPSAAGASGAASPGGAAAGAAEPAESPAAAALAKDSPDAQRPTVAAASEAADAAEQASGFAAPPPPLTLRSLGGAVTGDAEDAGSGGWPGSHGWVAMDADSAAARLGASLMAVPDLPMIGYAAAVDGSRTVRVTQRLPGGEEVEVLQRLNAAMGEVEFVLRAPLPADSLERLRRVVR